MLYLPTSLWVADAIYLIHPWNRRCARNDKYGARNAKYGLVTVIDEPDREPRAAGAARRLLARRMRILRATYGWSQEVLAELAGLHRSYISGIERTARNVSVDNIEKIALAFGVSMAELWEE